MLGLLAAVPAAVMILAAAGCARHAPGDEDEAQAPPPLVPVRTAQVIEGEAVVTVAATGRTEALRMEKIFSPVAGRLVALRALEGTSFREGDLMAVVRTRESQSAITGAEALLRNSKTPQQEAEARRALELAKGSEATVELRARFDGVVAARSVSEGELLLENAEMFVLVDLKTLVFVADVPLSALASIRPGEQARVRFTALPDRLFLGGVEAVSPQTDPQSQTVKVRVRFSPGPRGLPSDLKTDMSGSAAIVTGVHHRALLVPRAALLRDDEHDTYAVVTVGPDSLTRSIGVTVGATTDSSAEITGGGLRQGMTVVTEGNYALADSTKVTGPAAP